VEAATSHTSPTKALGTARATGLAVLRTYANLRIVPASPAHATLDATWRAGRAADLSLRMRRHGRLSFAAVEGFGRLVALSATDLVAWVLPALRQLGIIDYNPTGDSAMGDVEERVGVAAPVLEQVAGIWEQFKPRPVEMCAIASADHATYCPMTESDHRGALEMQGFPEETHEAAFASLSAIGLLRRESSPSLGEAVIWAPYVWGTEAIDIAAFMKKLPPNEQQALASLSRQAAEHPGVSVDELGVENRLMAAARHAGLLDATHVRAGSIDRGFAFSPGLEHQVGGGLTDATHERKAFVAHILNGHRYGNPWTGRIDFPIALVRALINKGSVGPTTAARTDYGLLEGAGIVRAEEVGGGKATLHLVKRDVAEDSLELLRLALEDDHSKGADSVDALWIPGTALTSPERDRQQVPAPAGDERELIQSTVEELREEIGRRTRGEELRA
jgi:hypothetical protein